MGFPAEQTQQRHDENTGGCVNKKIFKLQQEKKNIVKSIRGTWETVKNSIIYQLST